MVDIHRDGTTRQADLDEEELNDQIFAIQRSVRYHDRRFTHYDRFHRVTNIVTVMLAGVVMMDFLGSEVPCVLKAFSFGGAILAACDLVIGFSKNANEHRNLKRSFVALEQELVEGKMDLRRLKSRRLEIESDEPAIFRALDALCHIEICAAHGKEIRYLVPWYMRISSQWLHWSDVGATAKKLYERREAKIAKKKRTEAK